MSAVRLELHEKLKDLRNKRHLKLDDLEKETGIPKTTLARLENEKDTTRISYQDISALAVFYGVPTDYLFGLTDNLQYRNVEVDRLWLTDEAVEVLSSGRLNNRLLCELLAHPGFAGLLAGLEVFVDRNVSEYMEVVNKTYKVSLDAINKENVTAGRDEYIAVLKEASIDPDGYLRFRLSKRFEEIAQSLYDAREKKAASKDGAGYLETFYNQFQKYQKTKDETGSSEEAKLAVLAEQVRVDMKKAPPHEKKAMISFFQRSEAAQRLLRWKK